MTRQKYSDASLTNKRKTRLNTQFFTSLTLLRNIDDDDDGDEDDYDCEAEAYDLEACNSGSELGFSLFGCNVARAFSRACSIDLLFVLFVHIWA